MPVRALTALRSMTERSYRQPRPHTRSPNICLRRKYRSSGCLHADIPVMARRWAHKLAYRVGTSPRRPGARRHRPRSPVSSATLSPGHGSPRRQSPARLRMPRCAATCSAGWPGHAGPGWTTRGSRPCTPAPVGPQLLVRADGQINDPAWTISQAGLEDLATRIRQEISSPRPVPPPPARR